MQRSAAPRKATVRASSTPGEKSAVHSADIWLSNCEIRARPSLQSDTRMDVPMPWSKNVPSWRGFPARSLVRSVGSAGLGCLGDRGAAGLARRVHIALLFGPDDDRRAVRVQFPVQVQGLLPELALLARVQAVAAERAAQVHGHGCDGPVVNLGCHDASIRRPWTMPSNPARLQARA